MVIALPLAQTLCNSVPLFKGILAGYHKVLSAKTKQKQNNPQSKAWFLPLHVLCKLEMKPLPCSYSVGVS